MKTEIEIFADRSNVGYKKVREVNYNFKIWGHSKWKVPDEDINLEVISLQIAFKAMRLDRMILRKRRGSCNTSTS